MAGASDWLMSSALLSNAALGMALSSKIQPPNKNSVHRLWTGFSVALTMYFSAVLLRVNPWLVCASLVACVLLLAYLRITCSVRPIICKAFETYPVARCLSNKQITLISYAMAGSAIAAALYAPWLLVAMHGAVVYLHERQLWNIRRIDNPLSHDQHIDYWTRHLTKPSLVPRTWDAMQCYTREYGDIPPRALKTIVAQLDALTLLQYYDVFFVPERCAQALAQTVQEQLCLLDVRAVAVFELYGENKKEAALRIKEFITTSQQEHECFELPDLVT